GIARGNLLAGQCRPIAATEFQLLSQFDVVRLLRERNGIVEPIVKDQELRQDGGGAAIVGAFGLFAKSGGNDFATFGKSDECNVVAARLVRSVELHSPRQ